ncbi:fasciclin domain-containing protein [Methylobacterium sp. BTF04]|uniref:fasciclin domain-containing protein n=1 Tax=Methylobacterium sp. BTF04 TaxID=2708300 RepID=UPI00195393D9|nr:fasciclin domain-containing protein [Methylobacterium sp. BTF04]
MTRMFKVASLTVAMALTGIGAFGTAAQAAEEKTVMVGGAPMYPSKTIVENAVNSKDHTTLVAAVKAAGLVDTLSGKGPFTVFAPTNAAFAKLPAGTVDTLVKPENKATLTKILTYHVVAGTMTAADLQKAIKAGGGKAMLKTVEGGSLTAEEKGGKIELVDAKGGMSTVTIADVMQSNGVIHVVDTVLMPK